MCSYPAQFFKASYRLKDDGNEDIAVNNLFYIFNFKQVIKYLCVYTYVFLLILQALSASKLPSEVCS